MKIAIIGSGIIGVTCAIELLDQGLDVTIFSKDEPLLTNSDAAIATWYCPDESRSELQKLCLSSIDKFLTLTREEESGVSLIPIAYYFKTNEERDNSPLKKFETKNISKFSSQVKKLSEFPYYFISEVPLADANIYRPYLMKKAIDLGGRVEIRDVNSLQELYNNDDFTIVINAAGWESGALALDQQVIPIRGQTESAVVDGAGASNKLSINIGQLNTYIIFRPRSNDVVIGATHQENNSDNSINLSDKIMLQTKLKEFFPELRIQQTSSKVGVRCGRKDVRVESEIVVTELEEEKLLIHCYGHGGCGFSASWGSAMAVLTLTQSFIDSHENFLS